MFNHHFTLKKVLLSAAMALLGSALAFGACPSDEVVYVDELREFDLNSAIVGVLDPMAMINDSDGKFAAMIDCPSSQSALLWLESESYKENSFPDCYNNVAECVRDMFDAEFNRPYPAEEWVGEEHSSICAMADVLAEDALLYWDDGCFDVLNMLIVRAYIKSHFRSSFDDGVNELKYYAEGMLRLLERDPENDLLARYSYTYANLYAWLNNRFNGDIDSSLQLLDRVLPYAHLLTEQRRKNLHRQIDLLTTRNF